MPPTGVNDPSSYYAGESHPSLFWELTICQCLESLESPYQAALRTPERYGEILARVLREQVGLDPGWSVVEVGGGTGSLMAALLDAVPLRTVTMVDLSPAFLGRQRAALEGRSGLEFVQSDAAAFVRGLGRSVDLVISNENIGDFPTAVGLSRDDVAIAGAAGGADDPVTGRVAELVRRYGLDLSGAPETFAFNLGAVEYLEALAPVARTVFLSEHSSDSEVPEPFAGFIAAPPSDGYPRRVPLRGHDEYTIRFGHLEQVALRLGYRVRRLPLMALLGLRDDDGVRTMVRCPNRLSETAEIVHEFFFHVAEYQVLLLTR
ncbi:MAG: methyltransferase domain-containing protein [Deltaproteobacteria bacterium]|nr:methyltransferase domain-containing protein [Deltaproteobacteria bacterium]